MMEPDETVLSDVHLFTDNCSDDESYNTNDKDEYKFVVSRLKFTLPNETEYEKTPLVDEDGDFILIRPTTSIITIEHALSTQLSNVGLQVWNGALLLSDFIIFKSEKWKNQVVIELGSGTGLCSILLAMFSKTVFCTDTGDRILDLCQRNIKRNDKLKNSGGEVLIRELNWKDENPFNKVYGPWCWQPDDIKTARAVFYIFASDVIYDDDLTDAFFNLLTKIMVNKCYCLYVSLEKRLNFTLSSMETSAPAYNHFEQWLMSLKTCEFNVYFIEQIQTDFAQYFRNYGEFVNAFVRIVYINSKKKLEKKKYFIKNTRNKMNANVHY